MNMVQMKKTNSEWLSDALKAAKVACIVAFVAALVSLCLPLYFKSEATLLPTDSRAGSSLGGIAAAALGLGLPGQDGPEVAYPEIIQSRWLRRTLMETTFTFTRKIPPFGRSRTETKPLREYLGGGNEDQVLRRLAQMLVVQRDLKTKKIVLSVETRSPDLSQQIVNKAVGLLETFLREKNQTRGKAKAAFLGERLVEAREHLADQETALKTFMTHNRNFSQSSDPAVRLQGLRMESELRLQQQLVSTLTLNREQALLEEKNDVPLLNLLDAGYCPVERSRPARAQIVALAFLVVFGGLLTWHRREWIRQVIGSVD